jgi:hypothetical protein
MSETIREQLRQVDKEQLATLKMAVQTQSERIQALEDQVGKIVATVANHPVVLG